MFRRKNKQPAARIPRITSQPSTVFSYHASRSRTESTTGRYQEPKAAKTTKTTWQYVPSYIAAVIILVSIINVMILSNRPKVISLAQKTPNILRDNNVYEQAASILLSQSIWNKTKLTVDTNQIARLMHEQFPELDSVLITLPLIGHRPVIQILPAQPTLIIASQSGAYVIDQHGKALLQVRDLPLVSQFNLPTITDDVGIQMQPGKTVLPERTVVFVSVIKEQLRAKDMVIESMSLPAVANELHIRIKGQPYYIKFNLQDDPRQQVGALIAVKERLTGENTLPGEYVDVRIEGRAFYK